jgi:hypothetical protein
MRGKTVEVMALRRRRGDWRPGTGPARKALHLAVKGAQAFEDGDFLKALGLAEKALAIARADGEGWLTAMLEDRVAEICVEVDPERAIRYHDGTAEASHEMEDHAAAEEFRQRAGRIQVLIDPEVLASGVDFDTEATAAPRQV